MSFLHKNLKDWVLSNLMSVSVNHIPKKDPDYIDEVPEPPLLPATVEQEVPPTVSEPEFLQGDELTREFSFDRDIGKPHILHLCIYKINRVLAHPFVKFYMEKNTVDYEFPHKELSPELFKDFVEEEVTEEPRIEPIAEEEIVGGGERDIDDEFLDQIREFFKEKIGSKGENEVKGGLFDDKNYKGFLEINNNIFAFIEDDVKDVENFIWITIPEILHKKTITVDPLVIQLFTENKILAKMGTTPHELKVLYLCKKVGDIYQNVYYEQGENAHNTATIINEKVLHPTLKQVYLFSETPLPSELPIETIKRYAVFTDTHVIKLDENDVHYWATRSPKYFTEI
jgi:hypothetical protein